MTTATVGGDARHDRDHDRHERPDGMTQVSGDRSATGPSPAITVFLADDNLLVREGVRALLTIEPDLEVIGTAADYDELLHGAEAAAPQVIVTHIRIAAVPAWMAARTRPALVLRAE